MYELIQIALILIGIIFIIKGSSNILKSYNIRKLLLRKLSKKRGNENGVF